MNPKIKMNLWWVISSIVLDVPIVLLINELSVKLSDKFLIGLFTFLMLLVICAIIGLIANRIKKTILKIIWVILGFVGYLLYLLCVIFSLIMLEPVTDEEIAAHQDSFREMICREFEAEDHLDEVIGMELPKYEIVESICNFATMFPSETEYDVDLKVHFPEGLSKPFWDEIHWLASEKAPNPKYAGEVINKWDFDENNPNQIVYQWENSSNVGCVVTFNQKCDTVYVSCYKW